MYPTPDPDPDPDLVAAHAELKALLRAAAHSEGDLIAAWNAARRLASRPDVNSAPGTLVASALVLLTVERGVPATTPGPDPYAALTDTLVRQGTLDRAEVSIAFLGHTLNTGRHDGTLPAELHDRVADTFGDLPREQTPLADVVREPDILPPGADPRRVRDALAATLTAVTRGHAPLRHAQDLADRMPYLPGPLPDLDGVERPVTAGWVLVELASQSVRRTAAGAPGTDPYRALALRVAVDTGLDTAVVDALRHGLLISVARSAGRLPPPLADELAGLAPNHPYLTGLLDTTVRYAVHPRGNRAARRREAKNP